MILLLLFLTDVDLVSLVADIIVIIDDVCRLASHKMNMRARLIVCGRSLLVDLGTLAKENSQGS